MAIDLDELERRAKALVQHIADQDAQSMGTHTAELGVSPATVLELVRLARRAAAWEAAIRSLPRATDTEDLAAIYDEVPIELRPDANPRSFYELRDEDEKRQRGETP